MIIALEAQGCLRELGLIDVGVVGTVAGAMTLLDQRRFDVVILDHQLGEETSDAVARRLAAADVPFAVASGYGDRVERFRQSGALSVLLKPYGRKDLSRLLDQVAAQETG